MFEDLNPKVAEVRPALPASLSQMALQINSEHDSTEANARASIRHARSAGELLRQVKAQVGHGNWLPWIQEHCHFSERTARAYMRIAERWVELSKRQHVADLSLREGLRLLSNVDEAKECGSDEIPYDGRSLLECGQITAFASQELLRLNVYKTLATQRPFAKFSVTEEQVEQVYGIKSWADHIAKLILWRPYYARTDTAITFQVDFALLDLRVVEATYGRLSEEEAARLAAEKLRDPQLDKGLCSPEYWWARLWTQMKPDFGRLSDEERQIIEEASQRYLNADYWWASLWKDKRVDYTQLCEQDWEMIENAAQKRRDADEPVLG